MDGMNLADTIRPMQVCDFDGCIRAARAKYAGVYPRMHQELTYQVLAEMHGKPEFLLLAGRNVYFAAAAARSFMEPEITVGARWMFTVVPDVREFIGVIRAMERWGREIGAIKCGFGLITEKDFTAVAARLGYKVAERYYEKEI